MNNFSSEINFQLELFSTFFEKLTSKDVKKQKFQNYLNIFKSSIYSNKENLPRAYDVLNTINTEVNKDFSVIKTTNLEQKKSYNEEYSLTPHFMIKQTKSEDFLKNLQIFSKNTNFKEIVLNFEEIREIQPDGNTFFRQFGLKFFESLIVEKNTKKLFEIYSLVFNKQISLRNSSFNDDENSKEDSRKKFCNYLNDIIISLKKEENINEALGLFEKFIQGDLKFYNWILSLVKEILIFSIKNKLINNYDSIFKELNSNPDEIILKIRSLIQEPNYSIIKLVSASFQRKIHVNF